MDLDHYYAVRIAQERTNQRPATNPRHTTHRTPILTRLRTALHTATTTRTEPTATTASVRHPVN